MATKQKDGFSTCHPFINFYYFTIVIICAMFFLHPLFMGISILSGLTYSIYLNGKGAVRFALLGMLPMFLVAAIFNPLFSHSGVTILFFHPNGNPITLESVLYGLAMGGMLVSVMVWFSCFNKVMSSDKLTYLFGSMIPSLALVFSMTLRMVPRFKHQIQVIARGQKCIGKGVTDGNIFNRARNGSTILSILITWALENGVETAISMRSRGFGLQGRTHFSIFRWERRDSALLLYLLFATVVLIVGSMLEITTIQFFPWVILPPLSVGTVVVGVVFLGLLWIPMILNWREDIKWRFIQ